MISKKYIINEEDLSIIIEGVSEDIVCKDRLTMYLDLNGKFSIRLHANFEKFEWESKYTAHESILCNMTIGSHYYKNEDEGAREGVYSFDIFSTEMIPVEELTNEERYGLIRFLRVLNAVTDTPYILSWNEMPTVIINNGELKDIYIK